MKVFCIGFGKTGTDTLHQTASAHGLRSVHDTGWSHLSRDPQFEAHIKQQGMESFRQWLNYDFYSDAWGPRADLLERLFPDSYFLLNTRSLHNWLVSIYNHLARNRSDPLYTGNWKFKPDLPKLRSWISSREEYYGRVLRYFRGRDNFAMINVEADSEDTLRTALQTATGQSIKRLHHANIHKYDAAYQQNIELIEKALALENIPPEQWHRTDL